MRVMYTILNSFYLLIISGGGELGGGVRERVRKKNEGRGVVTVILKVILFQRTYKNILSNRFQV